MNKEITKTALKEAYSLVQNDLLTTFQQMKNGDSTRLNNIGTFEKRKRVLTPRLKKTKGKTYQFWQIDFRMSNVLKRALD